MDFYRFYLLDDDNHSTEVKEHLCKDDLAALDIARKLARDAPVEVWVDTRQVAHLNRGDADHGAQEALAG